MLVECIRCKARVNADELANFIGFDNEVEFDVRYAFLKCPSCETPLLIYQWRPEEGQPWDSPKRLYPPIRRLSSQIPNELRRSFREAIRCQESGHYLATALMCRRTLEGICAHHLGTVRNLSTSLKELHKKNVIDDRLFEWASALRDDGNLAAHDMNARISHEDAEDLVDFSEAILDYVFVLRDRFETYKGRRAKRGKKSGAKTARTRKPGA
ncbi:MAG: DUF4145 domain-containing protein [Deltaproteobacteria bacterium]|nr:DUF4145 domain-containing protein [Deltaproteobacteria bacterium]MBI3391343.1 DUF4145 domain-containing protein [Deltaproteobacteria bacterium]